MKINKKYSYNISKDFLNKDNELGVILIEVINFKYNKKFLNLINKNNLYLFLLII